MTEVVTIKFRGRGKAYYFDPAGIQASPGDALVVETAKGMELGKCLEGNHMVEDSATVQPLRPVVRAVREAAPRQAITPEELLFLEAFVGRAEQYLRANVGVKHVTGYLSTYVYEK